MEVLPGQAHESPRVIPLVDTIEGSASEESPDQPEKLAGDKGCSSQKNRDQLKQRGIDPVLPHKENESNRDEESFDREAYRERNIIERCIGWLKELRRIATRYEKLAVHYLGMIKLGMIQQYLKLT